MADNTQLNTGTGGDICRDKDRGSGVKTQIVALDLNPAGSEDLMADFMPTKEVRPGTGTTSSVANSVSSVTLLSSNANRRGATFFNDDTAATVYLKMGTTASTSSFAVKILPGGYYELPQPCYTGQIDAIASAATGNMRITELT
jgi:hypothetical protein